MSRSHLLTPEQERAAWNAHRREQLLYWHSFPLTKKIQMLEDMEEVAKSMHGGKLPPRIAEEPPPFSGKESEPR